MSVNEKEGFLVYLAFALVFGQGHPSLINEKVGISSMGAEYTRSAICKGKT